MTASNTFKKKNGLSFMGGYLANLQTINCPLCRSNNTTVVGRESRGGINIDSVICNTCALIYLSPKPSKEQYHRFYASGDYRRFLNLVKGRDAADSIDNYFTDEKFNERKECGRQIAVEYFKELLDKNELYFDFGCDTGAIMAGVQEETGCEIMGNEPSQLCAAHIKDKLGISILACSMEDIGDEERERYKGKVKLASIIGVLEHVNDPVKCLKIAYDMLVDEGYLYAESFDILKRMEMNIETVEDVATIDHQYYFHEDVYVHMLELCGFGVVRFEYDNRKGRIMQVVAKKNISKSLKTYNPEKIVEEVVQLNERAQLYRGSFPFFLKDTKNRMIRKTRKFTKILIM